MKKMFFACFVLYWVSLLGFSVLIRPPESFVYSSIDMLFFGLAMMFIGIKVKKTGEPSYLTLSFFAVALALFSVFYTFYFAYPLRKKAASSSVDSSELYQNRTVVRVYRAAAG